MGGVGGFIEDVTGINMGSHSSSDQALRAQQGASADANATQLRMFEQTRADNEPWRQSGMRALSGMENSDFQRDFTSNDFQKDPGYQFRMNEGMKAIQGSAAARGGLNSGATLKALTRYGQDFASNEYNNAYNRFNADRDRRFNRLSSLAGVGQTATQQVGQAGQNYANQYGANVTGAANAQAGQAMGQMQQRNQLIGNGAGMGMAAIMASDSRLKTEIEPVSVNDLKEMRSHLHAYRFKYINPEEHGEGEYIGVMAQDLEKSKLGRTLVFEDGNGNKQLDLKRVMMLFLASLAEG